MRMVITVVALAAAACKGATELPTPAAPSLTATVTYMAGGSAQFTGNSGYWVPCGATASPCVVQIVAFTTAGPTSDQQHPALMYVQITLSGAPFTAFPFDLSLPVGTTGSQGVGGGADANSFAFSPDSGTVTIRRLGGRYIQVNFTMWFRPVGLPPQPEVFEAEGTFQVPENAQ